MTDIYELFAIRYGHHDRTASHNFILGDPSPRFVLEATDL